jgi:hypothetical protein
MKNENAVKYKKVFLFIALVAVEGTPADRKVFIPVPLHWNQNE